MGNEIINKIDYKVNPVCHGYFLPQELIVTGAEWRHVPNWSFTSVEEAQPYLDYVKEHVDGIEYIPMVYDQSELAPVIEVAKAASGMGIELWFAPRFFKQIDLYPYMPQEYNSKWMDETGKITHALRDVKRRPDIDRMNPDAVKWFLEANYECVLKHFPSDTLHGMFWPEEHLGANLNVMSTTSPHLYHWRPTYSDYCLESWGEYCRENNVVHKDKLVDKFPVHQPHMVANGGGMTEYYPGFNIPQHFSFERYVDRPRNSGVWQHFDMWRCKTYLNNFLKPLSRQMHELFNGPRWRGVVYFGSSGWTLPYEEFTNEYAVPPFYMGDAPFGRQCGIDLPSIFEAPEINYVMHEYSHGIQDSYLAYWHELAIQIAGPHKDRLGLMSFSKASCPTLDPAVDIVRWQYIKQAQPRMLSCYALDVYYLAQSPQDKKVASDFFRRLKAYQTCGDPFRDD